MPRCRTRWIAGVTLLLAARGWAADPLPAAPAPRSVDAAVDELGASTYSRRAAAELLLKQQGPEVLSPLESRLSAETNPEIRTRLAGVIKHLFLKSQNLFSGTASVLGVSLWPEIITPRNQPDAPDNPDIEMTIAITSLQPGFPAAEVLRVGDRVEKIDGAPLPLDATIDDFRRHVIAHAPGDLIHLTILRDGVRLHLSVRLAAVPDPRVVVMQDYMLQRNDRADALIQSLLPRGELLAAGPQQQPPVMMIPLAPEGPGD